MEKLVIGLVKGRHEISEVENYIFGSDFIGQDEDMVELLERIHVQAWNVLHNAKSVELYVTGFTPCLGSVTRVCVENNIALTLYHFDRKSGSYVKQIVISEQQARVMREGEI